MLMYHSILFVVFTFLAFNVLYLLVFAIAGVFRKKTDYSSHPLKRKIAVLIPSYREDAIIIETIKNILTQDYPKDSFDIILIADQLQESTLISLARLPIRIIKVAFEKSTKAKSIKYALTQIEDQSYDILMILDADNIMAKDCLQKTNHAFAKGWKMIQLHRTAKNKNTPTAILDAASEEINNHIFRQGHRALGISSAIIGSGMAFEFSTFKNIILDADIENNPGEDREIYLAMLRKGEVCEYIEDALVFDEKVQSGKVLESQRTRWISAQLQYANRFWIKEPLKTITYNFHHFDYALQTLLLPRVLLLATVFGLFVLDSLLYLIFNQAFFPGSLGWVFLFTACLASLAIGLFKALTPKEFVLALKSLPATFDSFLKAVIKSKYNQQEFLHTPKEYSTTPIKTLENQSALI